MVLQSHEQGDVGSLGLYQQRQKKKRKKEGSVLWRGIQVAPKHLGGLRIKDTLAKPGLEWDSKIFMQYALR
jgi:hypothetical protein